MPSYRVVKSGHIVEIYIYQSAILRKDDDFFQSDKGGRDKEGIEERKAEYRGSVNQRARNKIRRLINANFDKDSLFITLTYEKNMQDIQASNQNLKKFVQKMKRRQKDFQYVAVIEFQKRGAIHYHMLTNYKCEWNSLDELQAHERVLGSIWGHGFADIGYKKSDNAGAYLIKYMTKDNNDERLIGQKRYFFSRSLKQPQELTGWAAIQEIEKCKELPPVFTSSYYSDFHGEVQFLEYNPKRYIIDYDECVNKAYELFGKDFVECI